ncbi:hypothetical protein PSHT_14666, partial [Puccinia striiformis]
LAGNESNWELMIYTVLRWKKVMQSTFEGGNNWIQRKIQGLENLWKNLKKKNQRNYSIHSWNLKIQSHGSRRRIGSFPRTQTEQYVNVNKLASMFSTTVTKETAQSRRPSHHSLNLNIWTTNILSPTPPPSMIHFNITWYLKPIYPTSDADMVQCAAEGLENWGRNHFVFENPYAAADDNNNDGEEEDNTDNIK